MIRYPKALCPSGDPAFSSPMEKGRGVWIRRRPDSSVGNSGGGVCIMFTGSLYVQVTAAADILKTRGIAADLYNLRFLKPVDEDYLAEIMNQYDSVIIAEEGCRSGAFAEYVSDLALRRNCTCRILVRTVNENFDALGKREELLRRNGLDAESIAAAAGGN